MKISENEYKLTFAKDMIYYLTKLLLHNHPNKVEMVSQIVNKWDARINNHIKKVRYDESKILAKETNIEDSVASILISIQQTELHVYKNEFKKDIENLITSAIMKDV